MKIEDILQEIKYNWLQKKLEEFRKCKIRDYKIKFLLKTREALDNTKKVIQIFILVFGVIIISLMLLYVFKGDTYLLILNIFSVIIFGVFLSLQNMVSTFTTALFEHDDIKDLYQEIEKNEKSKQE